MSLKDLIPFRKQSPANPGDYFESFRTEMNRLFNDFWGDWPSAGLARPFQGHLGAFSPKVEVSEDKETVNVTAELPGMTDKDISLTLSAQGDHLILKGEKKFENERKEDDFYRSERAYGSFQRVIGLPSPVDGEKVSASFKDGVLQVKLVKLPESETGARQIQISDK
ncbi:Hsp20/alpha crystallin family protein [Haliangium sp.]|uniref:Hsp20/alpha crystallin family protein n=1 Tax=Haliangium sp. TaxID=2663208 RepID=UPI003D09E9C8